MNCMSPSYSPLLLAAQRAGAGHGSPTNADVIANPLANLITTLATPRHLRWIGLSRLDQPVPLDEAVAGAPSMGWSLSEAGRTIRNGHRPRGVQDSNAVAAVRAGTATRSRTCGKGSRGAVVRLAGRAPELLADRRSLP